MLRFWPFHKHKWMTSYIKQEVGDIITGDGTYVNLICNCNKTKRKYFKGIINPLDILKIYPMSRNQITIEIYNWDTLIFSEKKIRKNKKITQTTINDILNQGTK